MAYDSSKGRSRILSETYLINLTSKNIYNIIDNDSQDLSKYNGKCEDIHVNNHKEEVKTICKKVLSYLEKSTIWNVQESVYDTCLLLNFWIYDKLTQIFRNKSNTDIAFGNFQALLNNHTDYQKNISPDKRCKDKFEILRKDDWDKRKELYDYYIDFNTIKQMIPFYDLECTNYYKYIEGKTELYKYFEGLCTPKSPECPEFYEKCKDYNPDLVLHNFPCQVKIEAAKNALHTEQTSDQDLQDGPHPYGSDLTGHSAHSSEVGMTQENSDIGTKVGKSVLGIAPIALTASALYRFTPLGQWIRKLSGSNNNITGNGFGDETQESGNMFF
ncbi:PIR Superfamily Protein, partial [Plasmodium ovale curtisi]